MLGPKHFKQFMVPHYRRISDLAHAHGVDVLWLDCDGNIEELVPLWLDAGINCMFPLEVGTWGADPVRYRKQYGKDLLIMGGFSKHILAESKEAIEAEVIRLAPGRGRRLHRLLRSPRAAHCPA
ncbi:MAG: uroporphyrinogen decarboxylase family protein [Anaerolineae bacterium]|nr:uroporphyrinogen decarboxylase family protein [Anaerolineae bacterium]